MGMQLGALVRRGGGPGQALGEQQALGGLLLLLGLLLLGLDRAEEGREVPGDHDRDFGQRAGDAGALEFGPEEEAAEDRDAFLK